MWNNKGTSKRLWYDEKINVSGIVTLEYEQAQEYFVKYQDKAEGSNQHLKTFKGAE